MTAANNGALRERGFAGVMLLRACSAWQTAQRWEDWLIGRVGFNVLAALVLSVLTVLAVVCFATHEPWRDETQSWLMARDMGVQDLWRNAAYEGHPIGWHLLVKPLTLAGLPFVSLRLVNLALALGAAAILIWKGPFKLWGTTLLIVSPPFIDCCIYARSYTLVLFLVMLQAWFHRDRMSSPYRYACCLGMLANTMVLCLPYAAIMGAWWLWESLRARSSRHVFFAIGLLLVAGVLAVVQIMPGQEKAGMVMDGRFAAALLEWAQKDPGEIANGIIPWLFILPLFVAMSRVSLPVFSALLLSTGFVLWINFFVYAMSYRHYFAVYSMGCAGVWIALGTGQRRHCPSAAWWLEICTMLLVIAIAGRSEFMIRKEVNGLSTNTGLAMDYVLANAADRPVAVHYMSHVCPFLVSMPGKKFWDPASNSWRTYVVFDASWHLYGKMPIEQAVDRIFASCPVSRPLLIFSMRWPAPSSRNYVLTYVSDLISRHKESVFVYKPREMLTGGDVTLPPDFSREGTCRGL